MMAELTLAGRTFPLRDTPPKAGAMLAVAAAERSGDMTRAMATYHRLITSMLDERVDPDKFDAALWEVDLDELQAAIEEAIKSYGADPSSPVRVSSLDSLDGQPTTGRTSKVVSLSQGTVKVSTG